ncbi:MAG: hypothetical protein JXQ79_10195 [Rhodobacteraceae bacterium]|nr:hypothetical protein [Paracoccaceae bacterium]
MPDKLDQLRFEQAYRKAREDIRCAGFVWRGHGYSFDDPESIKAGHERQAEFDRKIAELDALAKAGPGGIIPVTSVNPEDVVMKKAPPPAGQMVAKNHIERLSLERMANGGWMVSGGAQEPYIKSSVTAAFTDTSDMLAALEDLLHRDDAKREEKVDG